MLVIMLMSSSVTMPEAVRGFAIHVGESIYAGAVAKAAATIGGCIP